MAAPLLFLRKWFENSGLCFWQWGAFTVVAEVGGSCTMSYSVILTLKKSQVSHLWSPQVKGLDQNLCLIAVKEFKAE